MGAQDVAAQYVGLESRVGGIEKTVDNLGRYMRDETSQIRREMADQNAGLKAEMTAQNAGVIAAIDKLTQTASGANASMRTEFAADIKAVSDKQGLRANTLIALCMLGLAALGTFMAMNNRPTDAAIADLKASLTDLKVSTAKNESEFVPRAQINGIDERVKTLEDNIVSRREHDTEQGLRDQISALTEKVRDVSAAAISKESEGTRTRTIQRLDDEDSRLRSAEEDIAKLKASK